uniref:SET and MYND domaincontaining protein DDB_G0273589like [Megachile rotundata] n=2 Tax=Lepeophtheirus salmonis TaxID=72036 RepID=A0A0K2URL9_LEPSM
MSSKNEEMILEEEVQKYITLQDEVLVSGPCRDSSIVCLNCYGSIQDENEDISVCSRCGLPLCGQCDESELNLHKPECHALSSSKRGKRTSLALLDNVSLLFEVVLVLRCLHLRDIPENWSHFLGLTSHVGERRDSELEARALEASEVVIRDIGIEIPREEVLNICGILDTNSFEIPLPSSPGTIQAIYKIGCLPEHNCIPTGHRCFESDLSLVLRASVDLKAGDHITITYTDSLWPTMERRTHLLYSKHFSCICERCRDPTEKGSFIGALNCLKCGVGRILPENPLEDKNETSWICIDCGYVSPQGFAEDTYNQVAQVIQGMESGEINPEQCNRFITLYSKILNSQHAHMLDVKHTLLHLLGHHEGYLLGDLSNYLLQLKEDIARCLLQVAEKILPGISRLRGTTLYELYLTYQQRALNWKGEGKKQEEILAAFRTAKDVLSQSIQYLQFEPKHQPEGQLAERAQEDLNTLTNWRRLGIACHGRF